MLEFGSWSNITFQGVEVIDAIHARLEYWALDIQGGMSAGGVASIWNKILSGEMGSSCGNHETKSGALAYETEKAVLKLPESLRLIVKEFYLNNTSTVEQTLRALQVSKRTLYRRLQEAHEQIEESLSTKAA